MSAYLDLVRFLAALAVYIVHLAASPITEDFLPWQLSQFGSVAVTIFFVLSGYVIAHVVKNRERCWTSYTSSRMSRLYSVAIVAALITFAADWIGQAIAPDFYKIPKILSSPPSVQGYAASLSFLNEWQIFGFGGISIGTNGPWWSLSFEATYYLMAGLLLFAPVWISLPASAAILFAAGPTIAVLAPLWGLGYLLYKVNAAVRLSAWAALALFVVGGAAIAAYPYIGLLIPPPEIPFPFGRGPFQRNVWADYFVALAFALHLTGANRLAMRWQTVPDTIARLFQRAGMLTFPLYLIHYPVLSLVAAVSPFDRHGVVHAAFVSALVAIVVIAATPICEWLKRVLRAEITPRLAKWKPASLDSLQ